MGPLRICCSGGKAKPSARCLAAAMELNGFQAQTRSPEEIHVLGARENPRVEKAAQGFQAAQVGAPNWIFGSYDVHNGNPAAAMRDASELAKHLQWIREVGEGIGAGHEVKTLATVGKPFYVTYREQ